MEGKKFILSIFFLFVLLLIISFSSAAINVTKPISNSNWSGSAMFNVTYVNGTDFTDAKNASFYYNASGVWTLLGNVSCNVSGGGTLGYCNGTLSFPNLEGVFSINATLFNLSTQSNLSATVLTNSVILDSKAPAVGPFYNTVAGGNYSGVVVLNVSVSDGRAVDAVYFNITNSSGVQVNYNKSSGSGGYYNFTFNSMGNLADGFYNMTVYANDTGTNNLNNSQRIQFLIDNTLPTATFSCSPNSTTQSQTVTCTCSPSDALSGINSALTSGFISNPDTTIAGTYTPVCNFYDMAGNFNSTSTSYTITAASGTTTTTTTTTTNNQINTTNILTSIIPANISVINNFDPSFGVSEMRINVSSEADNVQITLVKYNGVPDAVSVAKNGSVFEYLQIQTQNLVSHLNSATLKIEVNKTWISANSLSTDDIALFKYNETSNNWYQLTTTFINEDDTYDYYNVELQNFSYFAIGQKQSTITQPPATQGTTTKDFTWLWIVLVGVVGAAILIVAFILIKKRTE